MGIHCALLKTQKLENSVLPPACALDLPTLLRSEAKGCQSNPLRVNPVYY